MIIEMEPEAWDRRLAELGFEDTYYKSGYVAASAVTEGGRVALLSLRGERGDVFFPCIARPLPGGAPGVDVVSPYGYGGPVGVGDAPPTAQFDHDYEEWCRRSGVVTTFIRFHPFLGNHALAPRTSHLTKLTGTVAWSITPGRDLFASTDSRYRRAIKGMEKRATVEVASGMPALARFRPLYEETMRRNGATDFYFFNDDYWRTLIEGLGEHGRFFEARVDGELIASMLVMGKRRWLHCHLLGMSEKGRTTQAGKLIYYKAAEWGQQNGFEAMHVGGGVGCRDDSLLAFKLGFATDGLIPAYTGKIVHDPDRYRRLSGTDEIEGFFPAYRRVPVPASNAAAG